MPSSSITPVAILGVGRRTRTVPPALRRALQARDRGCRFPGCGSRFAEAHHIVHWADGGATELRNLVLLCLRHHRAVHEGGMRICMDRQASVVFFTAQGRAVGGTTAASAGGWGGREGGEGSIATPVRALPPAPPLAAAYPGADGYRRDRDIPWALEARARDALDAG